MRFHLLFSPSSLSWLCALIPLCLDPANAAPPDPFDGFRHLLVVRFTVREPVTETEDQFRAVLQLMDAIDSETAGVAEHHPAKDATCDQCHVKDLISVDHYGLMINEASPAKSCEKAGCHSLTVAGKMPFYVRPFASLDETKSAGLAKQRLAAARDLLQYTGSLKNSTAVRLGGLPKIRDFAIDVRATDKNIFNLTRDVPLAFFEPKNAFEVKKNADLLPQYAAALSNEVLSLVEQDMSVTTRLDGTVEAKMARAADLHKHLSLADRDMSIRHLLTNSQIVLRHLATLPADAADFVAGLRAAGRKVVFTNGCFDLLHAGHVTYLEQARRLGDALVVGLNTDRSVRALKGPTRPVIHEADRARVLAALEAVDAVVVFDEDTPLALIEALRPDVLVKGDDYREEQVVGAAEVKSWGGRVALVPVVPGRSTTGIVSRLRDDPAGPT